MTHLTHNGVSPFYIEEIKLWKKDSRRALKERRSRIFWNGRHINTIVMLTAFALYPIYRLLKRNGGAISFMLAVAALPLLASVHFV